MRRRRGRRPIFNILLLPANLSLCSCSSFSHPPFSTPPPTVLAALTWILRNNHGLPCSTQFVHSPFFPPALTRSFDGIEPKYKFNLYLLQESEMWRVATHSRPYAVQGWGRIGSAHTHTHTHIYTHAHTHTHTHTHTKRYTHTHTHIHKSTHINT
jgi:hypothetical protein